MRLSDFFNQFAHVQQVHLIGQIMDHDRIAREFGLSLSDMQTLNLLRLFPDVRTPSDISMATGMPSSTVTDVVDRLVKAGYLVRGPDSQDRRKSILSLTDHCQEIIDRYAQSGWAVMAQTVMSQFTEIELSIVLRYFEAVSEARWSRCGNSRETQADTCA